MNAVRLVLVDMTLVDYHIPRYRSPIMFYMLGVFSIMLKVYLNMFGLSSNLMFFFFFSSRRRHTRLVSDWSSDVCSSDLAVIDTPVGRLGLSVCYDVRFPELYRHLSAAGAQLLAVPSAFTSPTGRAHWETLLRARAIENLCYVVAPAQSGFHPSGRETYGDSMIVDYWGRVLQRVPRGRGCAVADVDLARQMGVRESFPALLHRALADADTRP